MFLYFVIMFYCQLYTNCLLLKNLLLLIFMFIDIAGLETLPPELTRNFNLMRDLDQRTQGIIAENIFIFMIFSFILSSNRKLIIYFKHLADFYKY